MNERIVIVDANLAFKCLHSGRGDLRQRLAPDSDLELYSPRFLFVELYKHKERLLRQAKLPENDILDALYALVTRVEFINEANIPLGTWLEAYRLCKEIDEKDTAYIALTLHLEGRLWTEDHLLKNGLKARGFDQFFPS